MMCYTVDAEGRFLYSARKARGSSQPRGQMGKRSYLLPVNSKLLLEIKERIEFMRCIEVFVVFAMGTLAFSVVPGCKRFNEFVSDAEFL